MPTALFAVDIEARYPGPQFKIQKGTPDEEWIPAMGEDGFLVISCNQAILRAEAQRQLLIDHKVGIVFLTSGQEKKVDVLRLILNKLKWLEEIDSTVERPFAFMLSIKGRIKRKL